MGMETDIWVWNFIGIYNNQKANSQNIHPNSKKPMKCLSPCVSGGLLPSWYSAINHKPTPINLNRIILEHIPVFATTWRSI